MSVEEVAQAVRNGADTVEKVTAATGAGADCDKCKGGVLQSIIKIEDNIQTSLFIIKSLQIGQ